MTRRPISVDLHRLLDRLPGYLHARLRVVPAVDLRLGDLLQAPTPTRLAAVTDRERERDRLAAPAPRASRDRYRGGPRPEDEPASPAPGHPDGAV
ncbi:hypothetical protein ACFY4C_22420 [Actinomadura viridis]|uniref:hypothetical protein n=1 Tax=Actinomadura viridis TaxID=58110 RepID=UPI00368C828A